jgi:CMP-N-acetylneuraminic acid synthetase
MNNEIIAFLPCRKGSERVKAKNTRPFAGIEGGLTQIKITQLLECALIDRIVVSTDDPEVAAICRAAAQKAPKPVEIVARPSELAASNTSTDDVVRYVPSVIPSGTVLWTHVTSPFVTAEIYEAAIQDYRQHSATHDSLMSVTKLQKFLWNEAGPVNYDKKQQKWPNTQTLPALYEINSAIFIAPLDVYRQHDDRIGPKPRLFELSGHHVLDIDWMEDFILAEKLWGCR